MDERISRFRALHASGCFVMPNPWDIGSAVRLERLGFSALATTSSGHAASMGRRDTEVTAEEMLRHAAAIVAAVSVPVNIDSERLFTTTPEGAESMVQAIAETGAAGCSVEDYDPGSDTIDPIDLATRRVEGAVAGARDSGMVVTARAENHIRGVDDLDDTIARLQAYRAAGADVLYAPGLVDPGDIRRVVDAVEAPVNVLARPGGPSVASLAELGVRRVSTGGALAFGAYATLDEYAASVPRTLP